MVRPVRASFLTLTFFALVVPNVGCSGSENERLKGRIVYSDNGAVLVANGDGSEPVQISDHALGNSYPTWSPDGSHIAFESDRDGDLEIFVMNADGSGTIQLTTNSHNDGFPQWSPDGSHIAFQTDRDGRSQFFVTGATGENPRALGKNRVDGQSISWTSR